MIYEYAVGDNHISPFLTIEEDFALWTVPYGDHQTQPTDKAWHRLFDLGKAMCLPRKEIMLLLYKKNVFNITLGGAFGLFLEGLDTAEKQAITTVSFGFTSRVDRWLIYDAFSIPQELDECNGLKTIISMITLQDDQKKEVAAYARKRGLKLLVDNNVCNVAKIYIDDDPSDYMHESEGECEDDYNEYY